MRILFTIAILLVVVTVAGAIYFRQVPMPAEVWHVEPADVTPPTTPNYVLLGGRRGPAPPRAALAATADLLEQAATAEGATRIAGDLSDGHATYVARTALMGFPDAVSIRLVPDGDATRVEIFSRSRYGQSDLGANRARVNRWIAPLAP
ncbi:hypothetical protein roselon_03213 [Roseibacterium elongatum DSM 19469]|uniref:DUF1499 domain-containing protein n=1 Tax=Roseicyclus elongatus DSM 19469 TaxID=1294273 RepID=W8S942_9RHOB|nr:DUF1499 domain-containing protein [Roseibacterium elongatum]AHM05476.1 hypothetical protein roselon_03213 [Roseibacterium elongatum DSM 19469]